MTAYFSARFLTVLTSFNNTKSYIFLGCTENNAVEGELCIICKGDKLRKRQREKTIRGNGEEVMPSGRR